jgi:hypothetical protein
MASNTRKFKKQTKTSKIFAETVPTRKKVDEGKLFDKNYFRGLGRLVTKVKSQVKRMSVDER